MLYEFDTYCTHVFLSMDRKISFLLLFFFEIFCFSYMGTWCHDSMHVCVLKSEHIFLL